MVTQTSVQSGHWSYQLLLDTGSVMFIVGIVDGLLFLRRSVSTSSKS